MCVESEGREIPPIYSNLSYNLFSNNLVGTLPNVFSVFCYGIGGTCPDFDFANNSLTGEIPVLAGTWGSPNEVELSHNQFTSVFQPNPFDNNNGIDLSYNMIKMEFSSTDLALECSIYAGFFVIAHNQFYGALNMTAFDGCADSITQWDISSNQFSGPLPDIFKSETTFKQFFPSLTSWNAADNAWDVPVPSMFLYVSFQGWCGPNGSGLCASSKEMK